MEITICYFAKIREQLGLSEEKLILPEGCENTEKLLQHLRSRGEQWAHVFSGNQKVIKAVNHEVLSECCVLNDGDEVAFFPPVTGG